MGRFQGKDDCLELWIVLRFLLFSFLVFVFFLFSFCAFFSFYSLFLRFAFPFLVLFLVFRFLSIGSFFLFSCINRTTKQMLTDGVFRKLRCLKDKFDLQTPVLTQLCSSIKLTLIVTPPARKLM